MSSGVFFNASSRNALSILQSARREEDRTQSALATGRTVNTAADDPGLWAVAQGFRAEQSAFSGLSNTLALGSATVGVARVAAETVTSLLTEMQTKIIDASGSNVDTAAIQTEIDAIESQIQSIVSTAQFNGVNLLQNTVSGASTSFDVLSMVDASGGSVATSTISVAAQDLSFTSQTMGGVAATDTDYFSVDNGAIAAAGGTTTILIDPNTVAYGASYQIALTGAGGHALTGTQNFEYVAREGDTRADVAAALETQINNYITANSLQSSVSVSLDSANAGITIQNDDATNALNFENTATTGGSAGGRLYEVAQIDVTTAEGRASALAEIDTLIATATNSAAALGSSESRINTQLQFVEDLDAIIGSGISALVDADLEYESARLAAVQAQQSLAREMLTISNNRADQLLRLFQ